MIETDNTITEIETESEVTQIASSLFANPTIVQAIPEKNLGVRKQFVSQLVNRAQIEFSKRNQVILTVYINLGDNPNRMPQRLIYALVMLIAKDPVRNFLSQEYKNELNKKFAEYCRDITHESTRTMERTLGKTNTVSFSSEQSAKAGIKLEFPPISPFIEMSQVTSAGTSQENSDYQKQISQEKLISHKITDETDAANSLVELFNGLKNEHVMFYYDWFQSIKREFAYVFEKRSVNQKVATTVVKAQNFALFSNIWFLFSFFVKSFREYRQSKNKIKILFIGLKNLLKSNLFGVKSFKALYVVDGVDINDEGVFKQLLSQFKILFGNENCMFIIFAPQSSLTKWSK